MRPRWFAVNKHFHLPLLGTDDHRLLPHPAHHVKRTLRLPSQCQFQHVVLNAALDDLAQLLGNGKESIGRAQTLQGLMGPPVIVVLHPQPHPFAGRLEAVKLCALEKLLPDGLPEAFDLAQGHGMMRPALDVANPIFPQFGLETRGPAPARVLSPLIGQHLLGHTVLCYCPAVHLKHMLRRLAAKHVQPDKVAGVVIHEADEIGILASEPEGENIALPHLVWG